jgi:nucleotide-binding universal stress UspA family protein
MVKVDPRKAIKSILVAVDGSDASYNALATVCDIARNSKARVSVLHVIEVPRALPLDADLPGEAERGENVLTQAERLCEGHRVKVHGELVQARQAGVAIVDEATAGDVDAIALGLSFQQPIGRFPLDEVSQYVLEHALCDVWLFRYAPPQQSERPPERQA